MSAGFGKSAGFRPEPKSGIVLLIGPDIMLLHVLPLLLCFYRLCNVDSIFIVIKFKVETQ